MSDPITGAAIASAGNVLGAAMSRRGASKDRAHQRLMLSEQQRFERNMFARNKKLQRQFAKKGISWKVRDAIKAGVHPLVALGAQVTPFSPIHGGGGGMVDAGYTGDTMADAVRMSAAQIGDAVANQAESLSRTRLNNAQADLLIKQAQDSVNARAISPGSPKSVPGHTIVPPQHTPHLTLPGGVKIKTAPTSDMQSVEDRYQEAASLPLGLVQLGQDAGYTIASQPAVKEFLESLVEQFYDMFSETRPARPWYEIGVRRK